MKELEEENKRLLSYSSLAQHSSCAVPSLTLILTLREVV